MKTKSYQFTVAWHLFSVLCFAGLAATQLPAQTILYQELFTNTTGNTNLSESTAGWHSYLGSTAVDYTSDSIVTFLAYQTGNPNTQGGYLALVNQSLTTKATSVAMYETFTSFNAQGSTITWNMGNDNTAVTAALMIQVGGNWYVSSSSFTSNPAISSAANFASSTTAGKSLVFDSTALSWYALTLTPGTEMTLDTTLTTLASSDITGIGFYVTTPNASVVGRFDSLLVTSVPEPAVTTLLGFGLLFFLWRVRRRESLSTVG